MARPPKLTPEVHQKIVEAISGGNFKEIAARWVGIDPATFSRWLRRGADRPGSPYAALLRDVEEAETAAEILQVGRIMAVSAADPLHARWWLERKFPDRWGRKDRHEIGGLAGTPLLHQVVFIGFPDSVGAAIPALPVAEPVRETEVADDE